MSQLPAAEATREPSPAALLRRLATATPLVRRALAVAVASGLLATVSLVVQASALAALLGALFHDPHAGWARDVAWFALGTLTRTAAVGLAEPAVAYVARPVRHALRRASLENLLDGEPRGGADAAIQLATRGVDAVEGYVARIVPAMVLAALAPTVLLVWMLWRDWLSAVIVAVSLGLLPIFMVLLGMEARRKMTERWREQQVLAGYFGDVVRGMTVLKSYNRSRDALANLEEVGASLRHTTMATLRVAFLSSFALELLSSVATALVALTLGLRLLNGSLGLNVALAVLLVTPEVFLPLRRAAAQFHASSDGVAAASELLDLVEHARARAGKPAPAAAPSFALCALSLARAGRRDAPVCDDVIPAGGLTAVVGPSGVGKTTLLRTLAGLHVPLAGRVLVDGVDLATIDRDLWRACVAWLPQDPTLPGSTVADVLRMGDRTLDDRSLRAALEALGLDLDLDRPLGEGAYELSAGQRRRVAIARCLVRRPLVLLLDEPTAHLDAASARLVEDALDGLAMTRVVATHRTLRADHVIDLTARVAPRG